MARFHVEGMWVEGVDLLKRRHWPWRLDACPLALLYSIWLCVAVPSLDFSDACIVVGLSVFHILVLLFTAWSVDFRCFIQFAKVKDIRSADACKITPAKFSGSKEIVPLHVRRPVAGSSVSSSRDVDDEMFFDFRKQRFIYSKEKEAFCKLLFPTKGSFGYYLKSTGHGTEAKVVAATD